MSILNKLTEGIRSRDLQKEGDALLNKWEQTGLLEGMTTDVQKNGMARLLENQAAQLLKESSSMSAGDVEGFASVAFPLVRRVFGGLLANDIVSVQPMSLPSGLIFFLDFTATDTRLGIDAGDSVYGGGVVAKGIATGVTDITEDAGGFYNLANAYTSPTGTLAAINVQAASTSCENVAINALTPAQQKQLRFDVDLLGDLTSTNVVSVLAIPAASVPSDLNTDLLTAISADLDGHTGETNVRRLTHKDSSGNINVVFTHSGDAGVNTDNVSITYPAADNFGGTAPIGGVLPQNNWGLEEASNTVALGVKDAIPEIDIKVDSLAVTAMTKKLKAKWSPELGQDLNAYHNLDAEVELTSILSEQIALEIDREILKRSYPTRNCWYILLVTFTGSIRKPYNWC